MNILAIIVATAVNFAIGGFWYSPKGFGKEWLKLTKMDKKKITKAHGNKSMALGVVSTLVSAAVLAFLIDATGSIGAVEGAMIGFWTWLGFIATTSFGTVIWENKPMKLFILNNSYSIIGMLAMGAIIGAWV